MPSKKAAGIGCSLGCLGVAALAMVFVVIGVVVVASSGQDDECGSDGFGRALGAASPAEPSETGAYGDDSTARYDLYLPDRDGPSPLVIYVHGGGWSSGSRELARASAPLELCRRGFAVASIDYRLTSAGATWPAPAQDVIAAIEFFASDGLDGAIDPQRIALFGASAGGHLASFASVVQNEESWVGDAGPAVRGIITAAGPTDFTDPAVATWAEETKPADPDACAQKGAPGIDARCALGNPATWPCMAQPLDPCTTVTENSSLRLLGCAPASVAACGELADHPLAAEASPVTWVDRCDPPHMVIYDDSTPSLDDSGLLRGDTLVAPSQGDRLIAALDAAGVDTTFSLTRPGSGHGADQGAPEVLDRMAQFLDTVFLADPVSC